MEKIQNVFKLFSGISGDGKITFEELVVVTVKRKKCGDDDTSEYKKSFKKFDKNGDGILCREELSNLLVAMGKKFKMSNVDEILSFFDHNNDDVIDYNG